jgi:class 3 adenylate cyclase
MKRPAMSWSTEATFLSSSSNRRRAHVPTASCSPAARQSMPARPSPARESNGHEALMSKSLLESRFEPDRSTHLVTLEPVRDYALEQGTVRTPHLEHNLQPVEQEAPHLFRSGADHAPALLDRKIDSLRAALGWALRALPTAALRLARTLGDYWSIRNDSNAFAAVEAALDAGEEGARSRDRARAELYRSIRLSFREENKAAMPAAEGAPVLSQEAGNDAAGRATGASPASRTFMFTDIVKSTDLLSAIGDEAWVSLLAWHDRALRNIFVAYDGEEISHTGDGFFVVFPTAPTGIECAVEIQRMLQRQRGEQGFAPAVRIGLHAGIAARTPNGYAGRAVHEAARITEIACEAEIVVSDRTLVQTAIKLPEGTARPVELKGLDKPVQVVSIDWRP